MMQAAMSTVVTGASRASAVVGRGLCTGHGRQQLLTIPRSSGVVLNPQWGRRLKPISPATKQRMLELHETDGKRWDVSRLASSYGMSAERVKGILYYQRKEEEARKAGTIPGERA